MSAVESAIKKLIEQAVIELNEVQPNTVPEFITIVQAAEICGCDRAIIGSLVNDAQNNNFPAVWLSKRTIRINKRLFIRWLDAGGLIKQK